MAANRAVTYKGPGKVEVIDTHYWFSQVRAEDRVSVKPHASPVLHGINYLLGSLEEKYLTKLRQFGGLQSYPSCSKDPDPILRLPGPNLRPSDRRRSGRRSLPLPNQRQHRNVPDAPI